MMCIVIVTQLRMALEHLCRESPEALWCIFIASCHEIKVSGMCDE